MKRRTFIKIVTAAGVVLVLPVRKKAKAATPVSARLCIRIVDNKHPTDPKLDPFRTQIGDVVCVVPGSHIFSKGEINCGQYKFIDVPGMTQADLIYLIDPLIDPLSVDEKIIGIRKLTLNAATIKGPAWSKLTTASKAQIDSITEVKK